MVRNLKQEIETGAKDLADRIREYSRSQVGLWQQVPFLAYCAKRGFRHIEMYVYYPHREEVAAKEGYLHVGEHVDVDLETGGLVPHNSYISSYKKRKLEPLEIIGCLNALDARSELRFLKSDIERIYPHPLVEDFEASWLKEYRRKDSIIKNEQFLDAIRL